VSVPDELQLNSESAPNWFVDPDRHHVPVNVRPPAASCTPAAALSMIRSPVCGDVIVNVRALETCPSGLLTLTSADPAAAMSAAGMLAVTRVALPNVVVRVAPFHSTVAPDTKFVPSTVSVNAAPPAVALLGVSAVIVGVAGPLSAQLTWATAPPPPSKYSTFTSCSPAVSVRVAVYVVGACTIQALMICTPSTNTRTPSSARAVNV
jgi:hypothetical protein